MRLFAERRINASMPAILLLLLLIFRPPCSCQNLQLQSARIALQQAKDSNQYVDAINSLAMLLYEKDVDSTLYYAKLAREIAGRHDYEKGSADALNNFGVVFTIKGNLQLALRYFGNAYSSYKELNDSANCVQLLMNIGIVYIGLGKQDRAYPLFQEAIYRGNQLTKDSIMSLAIYNYILAFPNKFGKDSLQYYTGKAKAIASKYNDKRILVAINKMEADYLIAHGQFQAGIDLLQQTIDKVLADNRYYASMDLLIDMGEQLETTDPKKAIAYYTQGLDIAKQNNYLLCSMFFTNKLFNFYDKLGDSLTASTYSRKLLLLHQEQETLNNNSSLDYFDYALAEEKVRALSDQATYQKKILAVSIVACVLAIIVIVVIRKNLRRIKSLNEQVTTRNVQLRKSLNALQQSQDDNTKMMRIVAHDLRNPISAMHSAASIMLQSPNRSKDDQMILNLVQTAGKNALNLVSDLFEVQLTVDKLKMDTVDIGEMLRYCVSMLMNKAEEKGQQIILETSSITLLASREKLWRVFSNLITNAIKFSPNDSVIIVHTELSSDTVCVSVKDEGIGIPANMQEKIFELFTSAKRHGTAGEQSFGLGLAISKKIVEAHDGKVWVESDPAVGGTTFFVELPIRQSSTEA